MPRAPLQGVPGPVGIDPGRDDAVGGAMSRETYRRAATVGVVLLFWHALGAVRYLSYFVNPEWIDARVRRGVATVCVDQTSWAVATLVAFLVGRHYAGRDRSLWKTVPRLALIGAAIVCIRSWGTFSGTAALGLSPPPALQGFLYSFPFHLVLVSAPMALAYAIEYARRERERVAEKARLAGQLAEARLEALRLQLNPHFLFNALSAIATLLHRDVRRADDALAALSSLLRASLSADSSHDVSLAEELRLLDAYLAIEMVRFPWLTVDVDIEEGLEQQRIPPFTLQLLVENAIRHGLVPRGGEGHIGVVGRARDGRLLLRVVDDGVGLNRRGERESLGIGLANARARLAHLYGESARLTLAPSRGGGVEATLTLPLTSGAPGSAARPVHRHPAAR